MVTAHCIPKRVNLFKTKVRTFYLIMGGIMNLLRLVKDAGYYLVWIFIDDTGMWQYIYHFHQSIRDLYLLQFFS